MGRRLPGQQARDGGQVLGREDGTETARRRRSAAVYSAVVGGVGRARRVFRLVWEARGQLLLSATQRMRRGVWCCRAS